MICSHFAGRRINVRIDEQGRLMEFKFKVKPETTADLAIKLLQL